MSVNEEVSSYFYLMSLWNLLSLLFIKILHFKISRFLNFFSLEDLRGYTVLFPLFTNCTLDPQRGERMRPELHSILVKTLQKAEPIGCA